MLPSFRNFWASLLPPRKAKLPWQNIPARAVIVRTDMIGDHIIFGGFLEKLRAAWPETQLILVAPAVRRELYVNCPCLDRIIFYDFKQPGEPKTLRANLYREIRQLKPDWIINPMYSRSAISDRIIRYCHAPVRIGLSMGYSHHESHSHQRFDRYYTHLISRPHFKPWTPEMIVQETLLAEMGIPTTSLGPRIWSSAHDRAFAKNVYSQAGFSPEKTIVYFSTASDPKRSFPRLKNILASVLDESRYCLIALGASSEHEANHAPRSDLAARWLNLCGRTTITQSSEIMRLSRLAVGVDTGPIHAARAVNVPHVVLVGGMLFGRFFPVTTPQSSVVAHPLDCYFCEGKCRYSRPYCMENISETSVRRAIDDALRERGTSPRLYLCRTSSNRSDTEGPRSTWNPEWIRPTQAEVVTIDASKHEKH